ncbi:Prolyl endopeptidase [Auxenochlorella protothecoides]|uniref:Prolyl endopeptidase n=1 Tax=Auxenochlorella protothecoides TaxID=3075 RepID=A0A087SRK3_AUXPR|nr:Prolyl endopeptidase [Auxenochlorella protothecoides]KFM28357.1 Prolyl endopeptidase [Auxenochlorella protothecoides]
MSRAGSAAVLAGGLVLGVASVASYLVKRAYAPVSRSIAFQAFPGKRYRPAAAAVGAPSGHLEVLPSQYPRVRRDDTEETLHGVIIQDPYRWLEDADSPDVAEFVEEQNVLTQSVLDQCTTRPAFSKLLEKLMDYEKFGTPFKKGQRYYYTHNTGLQAQSVVYSQSSLDGEPVVLIDPNTLSADGTVALSSWAFSEDGSTLAYALSSGGSDWQTVHVLGTARADNQELAYHVLGDDQAWDVTILALPEHPDWMIGCEVSDDGGRAILSISSGCEPVNRVWILDLNAVGRRADGALDFSPFAHGAAGSRELPLNKLVDEFKASYEYVGSRGSEWTFLTNAGAPRYRVVRTDISAPAPAWTNVVPQHEADLLQWVRLLGGGKLVCSYLRNVQAHVETRDFETGRWLADVQLPGIGSVTGFSGDHKATEGDVAASDSDITLHRRIATASFSPDDFQTRQIFGTSKDGTRVPMFVVSRKGLTLDGTAPTLLYGYGGFNISLTPSFSASRLAWMLAYGGVTVVANLRGGGEFGTGWRDAGSLSHKQNVFDDFVACAEELVAQRYCSPASLVIQGGSNGGLLVAACAEQRPDLFAAVLGQVGVMDLLRFHKFTIGHAWITDYGNPDVAEDFNWLLPLSPLHNVARPKDDGQYPAFLLTTGDHDDRVVPLRTLKLVATLQHTLAGDLNPSQRNPLLTRVEVRAGHGAGKPTAKVIAEVSDMLAFAAGVVGAPWVHGSA